MALDLFHIRDERTSGTSGGSQVFGWNIRPLSTLVINEIAGASKSGNQVILPVGTYWLDARMPAQEGQNHKAVWYNVTDAGNEIIGPTFRGHQGQNNGRVRGFFTIADTKTFELRQYNSDSAGDSGGISVNDGIIEIYADVKIWKQV